MTVPQIRGMFAGDFSRKSTLVEHGFRLPSALDNRPLRFDEWEKKFERRLFVSATPGDYEIAMSGGEVVEQVIRPDGPGRSAGAGRAGAGSGAGPARGGQEAGRPGRARADHHA